MQATRATGGQPATAKSQFNIHSNWSVGVPVSVQRKTNFLIGRFLLL